MNKKIILVSHGKLSAGTPGLSAGDPHILIDLSSWYKSTLSPKIEQIHSAIEKGRAISFGTIPTGENPAAP